MGNNLNKLAQRHRSKNINRNQAQRNGDISNETPHADGLAEGQYTSSIFKLNGHCFDELFEYLSLRDLHSLGQTCELMQQMTGEFFIRNYSGAKFNSLRDGIYLLDNDCRKAFDIDECIPIPGFMQLITWIAIENNIFEKSKFIAGVHKVYVYHCDLEKFEYIKLHANELKSVRKLTLTSMNINKQIVDYVREILSNIEVLQLNDCTVLIDLYDDLLKYCKNIRCIQLNVHFKSWSIFKYKWLQQKYEHLEHLELFIIYPDPIDTINKLERMYYKRAHLRRIRRIRRWLGRKYRQLERFGWGEENESYKRNRIAQLSTFFKLNSNLRSFACDKSTLMFYKDALINSNRNLDTFELKCDSFDELLWNLLHTLHDHGFYKRLNIKAIMNPEVQMAAMPFLKQLSFHRCDVSLGPASTHLIEYIEFGSYRTKWNDEFSTDDDHPSTRNGKTKNESHVECLVNVERLYLYRKHSLDILLFIQKLKNLKEFKIFSFESPEILQLDVLNRARMQLAGSQKVTIYVPDEVFLATKWATKNGTTNFSMIEMKRTHSIEWIRHMGTYRLPPGMF